MKNEKNNKPVDAYAALARTIERSGIAPDAAALR